MNLAELVKVSDGPFGSIRTEAVEAVLYVNTPPHHVLPVYLTDTIYVSMMLH